MGFGASKEKKSPEPQKQNSSKPPPHNDTNNNQPQTKKISHQGGPPYQPFTEFPDYQKLAKAQKDFAASTYEIDNDNTGIPFPFPPPASKRDVYQPGKFLHIDDHAEKADPELSRDAVQLVNYLFQKSTNDIEKVRAIWAWITSRNRENTFPELENGPPPNGSPLAILASIMRLANTGLYNKLFMDLCRSGKLPCKEVLGKIRASARELGDVPQSQGSYCRVLIDDTWRFFHPHWGSCYVKRITSQSDWKIIEGVAGNKAGLSTASPSLLAFGRADFWFCTDPEVMIHFFASTELKEQLLARPVTQDEYSQMARLYQPFFNMGLESINPPRCKLEVNESFLLEIGLPEKSKIHFDYGIFKRAVDPDLKHLKYKSLKQFVFMDRVGKNLRVEFQLPFIGIYKFELNAHTAGLDSSTLCEYFIDCRTPKFSCRPNPTNNLNEWGLGPEAQQFGLKPENEGGKIEANAGVALIKFRMENQNKLNTMYKYNLESEGGKTAELDDYVRHFQNEDEATVIARTPHYGNYILRVMAKGESEKKYKQICNYLVQSDRGVADDTPFPEPELPNGQIGILDQPNPLLIPVSHKNALIEGTVDGYLEIQMEETESLDVLPVLSSKDIKDCSKYIYHYHLDNKRIFIICFPSAGWYDLKIKASKKGASGRKETVYQYVIVSPEPNSDCIPFPELWPSWLDEYIILEPREGLLKQNHMQTFRFSIPGAESVSLFQGQKETILLKSQPPTEDDKNRQSGTDENKQMTGSDNKNSTGLNEENQSDKSSEELADVWEGEVDTGPGGGQIRLVVKRLGLERTEDVATYMVMTGDDEKNLHKKQRAQEAEAEKQKQEIDKRAQEEANKAEMRKRRAEQKENEQKDDFEKNKTKYLEKQRKLEEVAMKTEKEKQPEFKEFQNRKEEKRKDTGDWKVILEDINSKMRIERLREAIKARDQQRLEEAIAGAKASGVPQDNEVFMQAEKELEILRVRDQLRDSVRERDIKKIQNNIQRIYDNSFYLSRLQQEAAEAMQVLEKLVRIRDMRRTHLDMKGSTFSEMRRYNQPPEEVHHIVQAALLLFGEDEETTEPWRVCQQFLNPGGPHNMTRRVMEFHPDSVHKELAARCQQILDDYDLEKVQKVSPAAATFYVWAMGQLEVILSPGDETKPAKIRRQREILGRHVETPRHKRYDFRFSMRKSRDNNQVSPQVNGHIDGQHTSDGED